MLLQNRAEPQYKPKSTEINMKTQMPISVKWFRIKNKNPTVPPAIVIMRLLCISFKYERFSALILGEQIGCLNLKVDLTRLCPRK